MINIIKTICNSVAQYREYQKALKNIKKTTWSIELLASVLVKAMHLNNDPNLVLEITSKDGVKICLRKDDAYVKQAAEHESILNNLDDEAAVARFIEKYGR